MDAVSRTNSQRQGGAPAIDRERRPPGVDVDVPLPTPRAPRRGALPTVSVVVASNREPSRLRACLAPLLGQCARAGAQLIVARAGAPADVGALSRAHPTVRFVAGPAGATLQQLRGIGMAQATGDIVALTDDDHVADERWLDHLLDREPRAAAG